MDAQFTSPDPRGMRGRERRQPIIGKQGASPLRCASPLHPWTLTALKRVHQSVQNWQTSRLLIKTHQVQKWLLPGRSFLRFSKMPHSFLAHSAANERQKCQVCLVQAERPRSSPQRESAVADAGCRARRRPQAEQRPGPGPGAKRRASRRPRAHRELPARVRRAHQPAGAAPRQRRALEVLRKE